MPRALLSVELALILAVLVLIGVGAYFVLRRTS